MSTFFSNLFFARCFNLICALVFIAVINTPASAATKVNFRIYAKGDQPSGQELLFQATEKNKPLFATSSDNPYAAFAWYYEGILDFQQVLSVEDPHDLNMSFLRIESAKDKYDVSVLECHGYQWLNTALRLFLAQYPNPTELTIDVTLNTTFLPNPNDPNNGLSSGIGGWNWDPDKVYLNPVFIEASACNVTFKINGVNYPTAASQ
jgi:hypothetical protein